MREYRSSQLYWMGMALALSVSLLNSDAAWSQAAPVPKQQTRSAAAKPVAKTAKPVAGALNAGIVHMNRGYIAKAIPLLEQATREQPASENAWLWLARAYQKQGSPADFEKAKLAWQKVLAINPNNVEALSSLGELWSWDAGRRDDAISLLRQAIDLKPGDVVIGRRLAEALFWQGKSMDALRYAGPVASHYRNDKKFMAEYAQMLSQTGHADQALEIYNTVLKDESARNLALKLDLARTLYKSGQKQQAQATYEQIAQAAHGTSLMNNADFSLAMASLAFDLGLYAEAVQWDQSLPPAMQRQKDVQLRAARALVKVFRMPEAIEQFNRLYNAGLLNAEEKLEFAEYLRQLNLPAEGLPSPNLVENLYKEAMLEAPENGEVAVRLARYYAEQDNRFDETVQAYQTALASPSLTDRDGVKKEFLDVLKANQGNAAAVEALFQTMLTESPDDVVVKKAYAEFLSWQQDRRPESLRSYIELAKSSPENRELWEARIEEVLKWHKPTTDLIPIYQEIVNLYPDNKTIWIAVARAYRGDKHYYLEAVDTYSVLVKRYPEDGTIKREWLGLLTQSNQHRGNNIKRLEKMTQADPDDLDVLATYGKLLSYDHKFGSAMKTFDQVLRVNPEHRDALIGKGYTILWSGRKFEAKDWFMTLRQKYPDDVDVAIGLAQTEKLIGRYDEALRIIEQIRPLMQQTNPSQKAEPPVKEGSAWVEEAPAFLLVDYQNPDSPLKRSAVYDFSILPYDAATPDVEAVAPVVPPAPEVPAPRVMMVRPAMATEAKPAQPSAPQAGSLSELQSLQAEIDALTEAVKSVQSLQESSRRQLNRLGDVVKTTREVQSGELDLQSDEPTTATHFGRPAGGGYGNEAYAGLRAESPAADGSRTGDYIVGEGGMQRQYGTYAALDYDTNPILSGLGRLRNDELADLERGLLNDLRPTLRGGYLYSTQGGEETTTQLRNYGFPNQISFSLTPQIRLRGGISPARLYMPRGVAPDSTWGLEYSFGGTVKYWDRLTLDGDFAITHFSQSSSNNFTFQAQAAYDINDAIRIKLGARRMPQYNSLLSVAGLKPGGGAFRGDLVGQARENSFYAELNTHPFSPNWDWNLGYEWAFVDGEHIPTNYKNQVFTSLGYTLHYAANHQARLGYEFLYMGYSKNATNGYFDVTNPGLSKPVVSLRPPTLADGGYVFGGYFSPRWFILNAARLDLRGSLFNKFLEYKLGGSLGIQDFGLGHGIKEDSDASLASAFDANLIMNLTDWLAAYGNIDYLDGGGRFNRWRFGGGLILRPHIRPLSPMFGKAPAPDHAPAP